MVNRIPTKEQLKHKGCRLDNDLFVMREESEEATSHLFPRVR